VGWKGSTRHFAVSKITWATTPTFFFGVSEPAQKAVLMSFFWGGVYDLIFPTFFFDLRRISVGVFSELKVPKSEGHLLEPGKLGPL
jgi:hypothetical protein